MNKITFSGSEKVFYIADTHLGHANIIKHCNRPFTDVKDMDSIIIKNWNSVVHNNDTVIVLGDFAFRGAPARDYLSQLSGKKHLIIGNHDKVYRSDWESVSDMTIIVDHKMTIVCCHYPMAEWYGLYHDTLHFFGHIHNANNNAQNVMLAIDGAYNVGADLQNFTPMTAEEVINNKKTYSRYLM